MGYYCTVPQCTSLAGKTKNVKFHRFPRDVTMADKWNIILKRGKPYTKYSKVCSLHFTQSDYNVTTMGQWKTLSKDAVPSQNLPKLNPDGTVMVIRKSRTVKYKESRKEEHISDKSDKWCLPLSHSLPHGASDLLHHEQENNLSYRLQTLSAIASSLPAAAAPAPTAPAAHQTHSKPKKQDAFMQTDPVQSEEDDTQPNNSYSEPSEASASPSFNAEVEYQQYKDSKDYQKEYQKFQEEKKYETPKDFSKNDEYMPQTNEEYNKEAEKYALERKSHNSYEKLEPTNTSTPYPKLDNGYQKLPDMYGYEKEYHRPEYQGIGYQSHSDGRYDSVEMLRSQQHNIQALQEQHKLMENQNFFNESPIKQEVDLIDDDKYMYERTKEQLDASLYSRAPRPLPQVKQEPDVSGCDTAMHSQDSAYYTNGHSNVSAGPLVTDGAYYAPRPGPEMLIAKQNALAAHSQLWQNTMKRPFFYGDSPHYSGPQLLHRYTTEDLTRMLQ